ncbi:helix-turn-helix domain-containing protein [Leptospira langatensis]
MPNVETIAFGKKSNSAIVYKKVTELLPDQEVFSRAASLTIVCRGTKRVTSYDGDFFEIREGEAVFLPPDLYMISDLLPVKGGGDFESYLFFFPDTIIEEFLTTKKIRLSSGEPADIFRLHYGTGLKLYAENLKPLFQSVSPRTEDLLRIKLLEALQIASSSDKTGTFFDWLFQVTQNKHRDLKTFMEKNFDKRLSIEDYSILTGRSISSFQRDFKKIYGLSPKKWLTIQRMKKAKELLENGGASVTDVALSIGYENISHFIRAFQEQYEVTPGEFLKKEIRVR